MVLGDVNKFYQISDVGKERPLVYRLPTERTPLIPLPPGSQWPIPNPRSTLLYALEQPGGTLIWLSHA